MNPLTKFGLFVFSGSSVAILLLKIMTKYNWETQTSFFHSLLSFAVVLPLILAFAVIFLLAPYVRHIIVLVILFFVALVAGFLFIAPVLLGGV